MAGPLGDAQGELLGDLAGAPEATAEAAVWGALWSSGPEDSCIIGGGGLKRRHGFPPRRHVELGTYTLSEPGRPFCSCQM